MPVGVVGVTVAATVAAGQDNAQVRVAAAPGVEVSVHDNEAVPAVAARVHPKLIVPVVVVVLNVPFAGVVVGTANVAPPTTPVIAQPEMTVAPVPAAPVPATAIVAVAAPAAPGGNATPAVVAGV